MRISIMQPYFLPYAGYFRLFAVCDLFVVYDCVQFPRRSFLHRNKLKHVSGEMEWLTLPLAKAPQQARIDELVFHPGREAEWAQQMKLFPAFASRSLQDSGFTQQVQNLSGTPVDYIEGLLQAACSLLDIPFRAVRSSTLKLPAELRGQERILAICEHFKATTYVNSPGGRTLYDHEAFSKREIELLFLTDYVGNMASIAQRMADAGTTQDMLKAEIKQQAVCMP